MKHLVSGVAALSALCLASPALAWGPIGHRITAQIAEHNISGRTRAEIVEILGVETLPEAATWPDEERSNPAQFWQETASPWHYVTVPPGSTAEDFAHPEEGDAATALEQFTATLRDDNASPEDKALALRFVVHIVSDLHMPLHNGKGSDRGGNWVNVQWFDMPNVTNLHWVWDEGMILRQQLSWSEYAARLERRITPDEVIDWWNTDPRDWMAESIELRDRIYPETGPEVGMGTREAPVALSWDYHWTWMPSVEQRLEQSGVRLAAYLDWVFGGEPQE